MHVWECYEDEHKSTDFNFFACRPTALLLDIFWSFCAMFIVLL